MLIMWCSVNNVVLRETVYYEITNIRASDCSKPLLSSWITTWDIIHNYRINNQSYECPALTCIPNLSLNKLWWLLSRVISGHFNHFGEKLCNLNQHLSTNNMQTSTHLLQLWVSNPKWIHSLHSDSADKICYENVNNNISQYQTSLPYARITCKHN